MEVSLNTRATTRTNRHSWTKFHSTHALLHALYTLHSWKFHSTHVALALHSNNYHVRYSTRRLLRRWLVRLLVPDSDTESVSSFFVHETRVSMVCFVVLLSWQRALWVSRQCLLGFRSQRCITQRGECRTFAHPHRTDSASCRV